MIDKDASEFFPRDFFVELEIRIVLAAPARDGIGRLSAKAPTVIAARNNKAAAAARDMR